MAVPPAVLPAVRLDEIHCVPEPGGRPFGLFASLGDTVGENAHLMGVVFILGGIIAGSLSFLVLAAVGQAFRLFISLEHSLKEIAAQLGGR